VARAGGALIALFALVLHVATSSGYGYFRDEFYYLACADHLAAGYVDHPPPSVYALWVVRHRLGDSLLALHLVPAVLGAATVALVGAMARALGGGPLGGCTGFDRRARRSRVPGHNNYRHWGPRGWDGRGATVSSAPGRGLIAAGARRSRPERTGPRLESSRG